MKGFLPFYIGYRYTKAKRNNHFISFISLISILGIALGIAVLITVLSVMNGFDYEIHKKIFASTNHITIKAPFANLSENAQIFAKLKNEKNVLGFAPFTMNQALLTVDNAVSGIMISGIDLEAENNVSNLKKAIIEGKYDSLAPQSFNIFLGKTLAENLGVLVGDTVKIIAPQGNNTIFGVIPRVKTFTVSGIFSFGDGFSYDSSLAFINIVDAQKLFGFRDGVISGMKVKVSDLYIAPKVANDLKKQLPNLWITNWTEDYATYFKAIKMEKTMMFIILLFIIAVAAFNIVSSLVMIVNDKKADIAILKTMGASQKLIRQIFMVQGAIIGLFGTIIGVISGIILSLKAPAVVDFLEKTFHTQFISGAIYYIDYLPSKLDYHNVIAVAVISLILCFLATLYPAYKAFKTNIVEALKYE